MQAQNVRTAHGTVHRATIGRSYKIHGTPAVNRPGSPTNKADCGALTSTAAVIVNDPITCSKCLEKRNESLLRARPANPAHTGGTSCINCHEHLEMSGGVWLHDSNDSNVCPDYMQPR